MRKAICLASVMMLLAGCGAGGAADSGGGASGSAELPSSVEQALKSRGVGSGPAAGASIEEGISSESTSTAESEQALLVSFKAGSKTAGDLAAMSDVKAALAGQFLSGVGTASDATGCGVTKLENVGGRAQMTVACPDQKQFETFVKQVGDLADVDYAEPVAKAHYH